MSENVLPWQGARAALAGAASIRRKRLQKSQMEKNWEMVKLMVRRHLTQSHDELNQQKNHKTEDVKMIRHSCHCFWNKCWPWQEYKWRIFFCWRSVCVVPGKHSHTIPALLLPLRYGALEEKHSYEAKDFVVVSCHSQNPHLSWFAEQKNDHLPLQTAVHLCSWPDIGLHKLLWWPPPQLRSPGVGALLREKQRDGIKRPPISPGLFTTCMMDMYIDKLEQHLHTFLCRELAHESKRMCQQVVNDRMFDALRRGITNHKGALPQTKGWSFWLFLVSTASNHEQNSLHTH